MAILNDGFDEPQTVSDVLLAFPGTVSHLMPKMSAIPQDFRDERGDAASWARAAVQFFMGREMPTLLCRHGITSVKAERHLRAIAGSFEPKHEHKMAALAWLMSRWLEFPASVAASDTTEGTT